MVEQSKAGCSVDACAYEYHEFATSTLGAWTEYDVRKREATAIIHYGAEPLGGLVLPDAYFVYVRGRCIGWGKTLRHAQALLNPQDGPEC